jgi:hypothetical protein
MKKLPIVMSLCLFTTPLYASNPFAEFGKAIGHAGNKLIKPVYSPSNPATQAQVEIPVVYQVSYQDLFLMSYRDKTDEQIRADARLYGLLFNPVHYENYRNNEISMDKKLRLWGNEFVRKVRSLDALPYVWLGHHRDLGQYDVRTNQFAFTPFAKDKAGVFTPPKRRHFPELKSSFPSFDISLANTDMVSGLQMSERRAEKMLNTRQARSGEIDRSVYGRYLVRITGVRNGQVDASLIRYELFEDMGAAQAQAKPMKIYDLSS